MQGSAEEAEEAWVVDTVPHGWPAMRFSAPGFVTGSVATGAFSMRGAFIASMMAFFPSVAMLGLSIAGSSVSLRTQRKPVISGAECSILSTLARLDVRLAEVSAVVGLFVLLLWAGFKGLSFLKSRKYRFSSTQVRSEEEGSAGLENLKWREIDLHEQLQNKPEKLGKGTFGTGTLDSILY